MQFVLLDHFLAHRLKRAQADMQRDLGRLDSALANALKNLRREVQARGRRGNGARRFRVNRLVMLAIGGVSGRSM